MEWVDEWMNSTPFCGLDSMSPRSLPVLVVWAPLGGGRNVWRVLAWEASVRVACP